MADVSGAWLGTYWQQGRPTRFEATLVQGGHTISGNVLDDNALGEATVAGEVVGRAIRFTKRYITAPPVPIDYAGQIAADEQSMQGTWQITGFDSGAWEARRSGENLVADLPVRQQQEFSLTKS
ncbi:MAG: hypothetical protein NW220_15610 [Leptolyngbyaceae cyanobacterium bins.349]|nr:hypothetical protein [Leptolyngbyaceae cyanobacterium bins.349]